MEKLTKFAFNKYSQFGEDGIIEKIFNIIGTTSKLCIEFGAWDGFHLSNTANLWKNSWRGILIEGNRARFDQLRQNTKGHDCVCIHAYVRLEGPDSLEALLNRVGVSDTADLLSIDVDGDDYHLMGGVEELQPRVIVCEYNPTIPALVDLYSEYGSNFGASVSALKRLGARVGYDLVALTQTNAFFVQNEFFGKFSSYETRLEKIKIDSSLVHLMTSYSGEYVLGRDGPYGVTFPYRGGLIGEHLRVRFKGLLSEARNSLIRLAKRRVKGLLGWER